MPARKNPEKYEDELRAVHGDSIIVLEKYVKASVKIKVQHVVCGATWYTYPQNLLRGHSCARCAGNAKHSQEAVQGMVEACTNSEYKLLSKYAGHAVRLTVRHEKCGHTYEVALSDFQDGKRCGKCFGNAKKTQSEFEDEVRRITSGEYDVVGNYITARAKVLMRHVDCGNVFNVRVTSFLGSGSRCPKCAKSKGEQKIARFLDDYGVPYKAQHRFVDCVDSRQLPFDFAILNDGGDVVMLIEFDGRQHFESFEHFGGDAALADRIRKDGIKNQYCKDNGLHLLRISHFDFKDIDAILTQELNEKGIL